MSDKLHFFYVICERFSHVWV